MDKLNIGTLGKSVQSFDPREYNRLKVDSYNAETGNLTGYDCTKCNNRGNIALCVDADRIAFQECDCMKIRRCVQKMEASGLCEVIKRYTFEAYQDNEMWQKAIKKGAMEFANNPNSWLLFCGQSGSGKTHLCTAVCRKLLLAGEEVLYMPWRKDAAEIKAMDPGRRAEEIKKLQTASVLFIDDLFKVGKTAEGTASPTQGDINLAFDIINHRYTKQLVTIVSTERTPAELVEIDEATGGRIIERAKNSTYSIRKEPGRNYRLRGVVTV